MDPSEPVESAKGKRGKSAGKAPAASANTNTDIIKLLTGNKAIIAASPQGSSKNVYYVFLGDGEFIAMRYVSMQTFAKLRNWPPELIKPFLETPDTLKTIINVAGTHLEWPSHKTSIAMPEEIVRPLAIQYAALVLTHAFPEKIAEYMPLVSAFFDPAEIVDFMQKFSGVLQSMTDFKKKITTFFDVIGDSRISRDDEFVQAITDGIITAGEFAALLEREKVMDAAWMMARKHIPFDTIVKKYGLTMEEIFAGSNRLALLRHVLDFYDEDAEAGAGVRASMPVKKSKKITIREWTNIACKGEDYKPDAKDMAERDILDGNDNGTMWSLTDNIYDAVSEFLHTDKITGYPPGDYLSISTMVRDLIHNILDDGQDYFRMAGYQFVQIADQPDQPHRAKAMEFIRNVANVNRRDLFTAFYYATLREKKDWVRLIELIKECLEERNPFPGQCYSTIATTALFFIMFHARNPRVKDSDTPKFTPAITFFCNRMGISPDKMMVELIPARAAQPMPASVEEEVIVIQDDEPPSQKRKRDDGVIGPLSEEDKKLLRDALAIEIERYRGEKHTGKNLSTAQKTQLDHKISPEVDKKLAGMHKTQPFPSPPADPADLLDPAIVLACTDYAPADARMQESLKKLEGRDTLAQFRMNAFSIEVLGVTLTNAQKASQTWCNADAFVSDVETELARMV